WVGRHSRQCFAESCDQYEKFGESSSLFGKTVWATVVEGRPVNPSKTGKSSKIARKVSVRFIQTSPCPCVTESIPVRQMIYDPDSFRFASEMPDKKDRQAFLEDCYNARMNKRLGFFPGERKPDEKIDNSPSVTNSCRIRHSEDWAKLVCRHSSG